MLTLSQRVEGWSCTPPHSSHRPVDGERMILFAEDPTVTRAAILVRENRQGRWVAEALAPICREHKIVFTTNTIAALMFLRKFWPCCIPRPAPFPRLLKSYPRGTCVRQLITHADSTPCQSPRTVPLSWPLDPPQPEPVLKARYLCRSLPVPGWNYLNTS